MNLILKRQTIFGVVLVSVVVSLLLFIPIQDWVVDRKLSDSTSEFAEEIFGLVASGIEDIRKTADSMDDCSPTTINQLTAIPSDHPNIVKADFYPLEGRSCIESSRVKEWDKSKPLLTIDALRWETNKKRFNRISVTTTSGMLILTIRPINELLKDCPKCIAVNVAQAGSTFNLFASITYDYEHTFQFSYIDNVNVVFHLNKDAKRIIAGATPIYLSMLICMSAILIVLLLALNQSDNRMLENLLNEAIDKQALKPFYQPIVKREENGFRIVGAEVLVRWITRNGKTILPSSFIPLAEQNNLIDRITDQLIDNVLAQLVRLQLPPNFFVSINIPPAYLEKKNVANKLIKKIELAGLSYDVISLEVTERTPFKNLDKAAKSIEILKAKGMSVKLDDCGMGYGAFEYLQSLNIDTIKIDLMFVKTIDIEPKNTAILDAIIAFGKTSDLHIVAEGVENNIQSDYLIDAGVDMLQGDFFGEPMNFYNFRRVLTGSTYFTR
ncbi:EAL domain-containing protein [Veronia pacifica]|uniref:EAL domain-containing protein n=1 Tax=Veronia pacifica TaxID=1080227 RepID=A0A1C3EMU8_9GAMM|nr:EAL domain-containing protein [Veronia pacifica]ODA34566.1 hypothetical protein A8L45_06250 [Veronia pacifica]